ncbi:MAG: cytidine deaminase [Burkholderiaceae bacterium]|nr:cytidine deaminase [Burkholderiaceae bacterium]
MSDNPWHPWQQRLADAPAAARPHFEALLHGAGRLGAAGVRALAQALELPLHRLMMHLLPFAQRLAVPAISDFYVGAVASGEPGPDGWPALYFGANVEFRGQALGFVVHAEQSAVNHAWLCGEPRLHALAVSAAPCGYCRQFLFELAGGADLPILLPEKNLEGLVARTLGSYLPHAFGPADLGKTARLMAPSQPPLRLELASGDPDDPLVRAALQAAALSHAPYSGGHAGCALQTQRGRIHAGRYAENAAYNPSLPALASAIANQRVSQPPDEHDPITRAVLVEVASSAGQRSASRAMLDSWAPGVELVYCPAHRSTDPGHRGRSARSAVASAMAAAPCCGIIAPPPSPTPPEPPP